MVGFNKPLFSGGITKVFLNYFMSNHWNCYFWHQGVHVRRNPCCVRRLFL